MKTILGLIVVAMMTSCGSSYMTIEAVDDGELSYIKHGVVRGLVFIGDTLVIEHYVNELSPRVRTSVYGFYKDTVPSIDVLEYTDTDGAKRKDVWTYELVTVVNF